MRMRIITEGSGRYLDTFVNGIELIPCRDYEVTVTAIHMAGSPSGSLLIFYEGELWWCDGIDPTTGKQISQEVIDGFKTYANWVAVIQ